MSEGIKNPAASRFGMWLFLYSEMILFGGLFIIYQAARRRYPAEFHLAAGELSLFFGAMNTGILISSSLLVALAVAALKRGEKRRPTWFLLGTIFFACLFLGNKVLEWMEKIQHGIFPNAPDLLAQPRGRILFVDLYYLMTGLHGLHVAVGAVLFIVVMFLIHKDRVDGNRPSILENSGLYWHLVDIIWIYIFPLFYLIT
jgi:cytochrome c oxidase subunit III